MGRSEAPPGSPRERPEQGPAWMAATRPSLTGAESVPKASLTDSWTNGLNPGGRQKGLSRPSGSGGASECLAVPLTRDGQVLHVFLARYPPLGLTDSLQNHGLSVVITVGAHTEVDLLGVGVSQELLRNT